MQRSRRSSEPSRISRSSRTARSRSSRGARAGTTPAALAHLELELFTDEPAVAHLDGAIRFLEAAGSRGTAELVASEVASLVRGGTPAEAVGIVCESPDRWRAPLEAALAQLHVPYAVESRLRLGDTTLGRSLLALLRFAWRGGSRGDLFAYLRSPYSGIERRSVDFVEGRLRGRAMSDPARVEEESEKLRGAPIPALVELRASPEPGLRGACGQRVDDAKRLGSRLSAGRRRGKSRRADAARARARAVRPRGIRGRRLPDLCGRDARRARAHDRGSGYPGVRARGDPRPRARPHPHLRGRLRARTRGRRLPAPRTTVATSERRPPS